MKLFEEKAKKKNGNTAEKILYDDEIKETCNETYISNESSCTSVTSSDQSGHISKSSIQTKPKKDVRRKVDGQGDTKAISKPYTSAKKLVKNIKSNSIPETSNTDESSDAITSSENERHAENEQNVTHIQHTDTDMTFSKEILLLHKAIKSLTVEVSMQTEEIRKLKFCIDNTLKVKIDAITIEKFVEKHNVMLKLLNIEQLENFNEKLSAGGEFLSDFKSSLGYLVQENMYKSILVILKRLMDRGLAVQCTAVCQRKNKYVFKDTELYKILFASICNSCATEGKLVTEKEFNKALGSIFNNAKDWDGQRNVRRLATSQVSNTDN
ncbi:uncharacterized protein LOC105834469 isoform X1 [Monomorium pharaonis]|uniref:uncharacterized protein LOC105834469 isoform X1 n=1 Tax=Monomorium pharaonis TaxID=307658 RepID=UPI001746F94F|nr:uncharacterized protein LOC105834469 isoform X1 [Monomorium pharaonis]XP_036142987.1 uncharacterized protein LOC105834469 isoform X1 [Monomorium pharaonis]XP_036142991.1 uncharacterized protein LOC105834469 isoform X1 [Monomorium pharaonis]